MDTRYQPAGLLLHSLPACSRHRLAIAKGADSAHKPAALRFPALHGRVELALRNCSSGSSGEVSLSPVVLKVFAVVVALAAGALPHRRVVVAEAAARILARGLRRPARHIVKRAARLRVGRHAKPAHRGVRTPCHTRSVCCPAPTTSWVACRHQRTDSSVACRGCMPASAATRHASSSQRRPAGSCPPSPCMPGCRDAWLAGCMHAWVRCLVPGGATHLTLELLMLCGESEAGGAKGDCARSSSLDTPKRKPPAPGAAAGPARAQAGQACVRPKVRPEVPKAAMSKQSNRKNDENVPAALDWSEAPHFPHCATELLAHITRVHS